MSQNDTNDTNDTTTCNTNNRGRCWIATWNNYELFELENLKGYLQEETEDFVLQPEIGSNGTPHLQFCFKFKNARTFKSVKKDLPSCHIEKAKNWNACKNYCCKSETKAGETITKDVPVSAQDKMNQIILMEEYNNDNPKWRKWQQNVLDIINTHPDRRVINWFWEDVGNVGKSYLSMYIDMKWNTIICDGKSNDVINQVKVMVIDNNIIPDVVILDIPRYNEGFTNYGVIEKLKSGLLYSGKYEGGKIRLTPLHVFIFANFEPDVSKFSLDRWNIVKIGDTDTVDTNDNCEAPLYLL